MENRRFELAAPYQPTGDQPQAIRSLTEGVREGMREQTLLGVTGSGKTFTMANVIANVQKPTLVLAHNKTLAAQLCSEFREFFPKNAVEYFVSYYDYYQPEAYIPGTDTYIEKDSAINDEIDKLRHSATCALGERNDVIIVASVSCIYSLGAPEDYRSMVVSLRPGMQMERDELLRQLVDRQYDRNDINFVRGKFRVRGDVVEIFPAGSGDIAVRVEFFGDEIDRISEFDPLTGAVKAVMSHVMIYPASHFITPPGKMVSRRACFWAGSVTYTAPFFCASAMIASYSSFGAIMVCSPEQMMPLSNALPSRILGTATEISMPRSTMHCTLPTPTP